MFDSVFGKSFNSGKCKTLLKLAVSRIKLLRNKRDIQLKQMKRELAQLLQTNQDASARIRVEHVYREQNIMAAYEIIELFCELIVVRLPIIESQRHCPIDLREAIASLVFAAPRCADLPELQQIRTLFGVKYGKEFVAGAAELRPDCGVNRLIIEKLSVRAPSGEVKLKLMKEIAAEQAIEWDPTASESELLKAPEDLLEGSSRFLGASEMPLQMPPEEAQMKEVPAEQSVEKFIGKSDPSMLKDPDASLSGKQYIPFVLPVPGDTLSQDSRRSSFLNVKVHSQKGTYDPSSSDYVDADLKIEEITDSDAKSEHRRGPDRQSMPFSSSKHLEYVSERDENFKNVAAAARSAAESADRAVAAARAAASLANGSGRNNDKSTSESSSDSDENDFKGVQQSERRPSKKYSRSNANSFNEENHDEKPVFDEYVENTSSREAQQSLTRKEQSWKDRSSGENRSGSFSKYADTKFDEDFGDQDDSELPFINTGRPGKFLRHEECSLSKDHILKSESMIKRYSESGDDDPHFDDLSVSVDHRQQSTLETQVSDEADSHPPQRSPPNLPGDYIGAVKPVHVHPKLPDYDDLASRFESLKTKRS